MEKLDFPEVILRETFKANNGEYGWKQHDVPEVVKIISDNNLAILGGELWWVPKDSKNWIGLIPQEGGTTAVYSWETKMNSKEQWNTFIDRCAKDTLVEVEQIPIRGKILKEIEKELYFNLTYIAESEYYKLKV